MREPYRWITKDQWFYLGDHMHMTDAWSIWSCSTSVNLEIYPILKPSMKEFNILGIGNTMPSPFNSFIYLSLPNEPNRESIWAGFAVFFADWFSDIESYGHLFITSDSVSCGISQHNAQWKKNKKETVKSQIGLLNNVYGRFVVQPLPHIK